MTSIADLQARYQRVCEQSGIRSMSAIKAWNKLQAAVHAGLAEKDRIRIQAVSERRV